MQGVKKYDLLYFSLCVSHSSCPTLCDSLVCPWKSPGKNTGVGYHSLEFNFYSEFPRELSDGSVMVNFTVSSNPTTMDADTG